MEASATTQNPLNFQGDVETVFNYHKDVSPEQERAIYGTAQFWRKPYEQRKSIVHDIRGNEKDFKLDVHGFEYHKIPSSLDDFSDPEKIKSIYYPEVERYLKEITGASRIIFIIHVNRTHSIKEVAAKIADVPDDSEKLLGLVPPLQHVHVDQSYDGINNMIDYCVPAEEADGLKKVRHSIINVWRPIRTVTRDPLALSDARSVPEEDLVHVTTHLAKGRTNMTWGVLPPDVDEKTGRQEKHKWYWCSQMTPDEVFLFKILDSKLDGRARRDPHSAFHIDGTEGEPTRESIEMRCMVFWEAEPKE